MIEQPTVPPTMLVRTLRELLANVPDDTRVFVHTYNDQAQEFYPEDVYGLTGRLPLSTSPDLRVYARLPPWRIAGYR